MSTLVRIVFCTVPSEAVAESLARTVVEERLAACVNVVGNVRSIYRYQGKVEDDRELLLVAKTTCDRFEALRERLVELHPYEVCEVLGLDVASGADAYLDWVAAETRPA